MNAVRRPASVSRSVLVALLLAAGGVLVANLFTLPPTLLDPTLTENPAEASRAMRLVLLTLNFLGFVAVGGAYLWYTDRDSSWLDLSVPSLRGWVAVVGAVGAAIVLLFAVGIVSTLLGVQPTQNQVVNLVGDDPTMVLLLILVVVFLNAPAEEFLFRNVVQKRLYAATGKPAAVVIASVIFALVHLPSYMLAGDGGLATPAQVAVPLLTVFGGSLIFGYLYARTENLVAPIAAHAGFNTFQFLILYLVLRFAPEQAGDPGALPGLVAALA